MPRVLSRTFQSDVHYCLPKDRRQQRFEVRLRYTIQTTTTHVQNKGEIVIPPQ